MRRAGGGQAQAVHASAGQDKAERVLSAIRLKLGPELSVEYRVNQLIQEARNEEYLSKIFVGELGLTVYSLRVLTNRLAIVAVITMLFLRVSNAVYTPSIHTRATCGPHPFVL